jgi:hypothetical protein
MQSSNWSLDLSLKITKPTYDTELELQNHHPFPGCHFSGFSAAYPYGG